jgi:hypothetical protein
MIVPPVSCLYFIPLPRKRQGFMPVKIVSPDYPCRKGEQEIIVRAGRLTYHLTSQPHACAVPPVTEGFRTFAACIDMNGDKSIQKAVIGGVGNVGIARAFPPPNHPHRLKSGGCSSGCKNSR